MQPIIPLFILGFKMKHKINVIGTFILVLLCSSLYIISEKKVISESEKRVLTTLPRFSWKTYFNADFMKEHEKHINDHFPFRKSLILFAGKIRQNMGVQRKNSVKIVIVDPVPKNTPDVADSSYSKNYLDDFQEAYSGSMLILDGCVYTLNSGNPSVSPIFAKMINYYAHLLQGRTRVFSCVAPLSSGFIPVKNYQKYNTRNRKTLEAIRSSLDSNAYFADVLTEMDQHFNEKLWFGSDHHWTGLGAYYGYVAYCRSAGIAPVPISQMRKVVRFPFLGSLYELTRDNSVRQKPDSLILYIPPNISTEAVRYNPYDFKYPIKISVFSGNKDYTAFLSGDAPLIKIKTSVKNGRRAAVVKNSMGNAFAVYLISHYEEIYVFDFRYSKHNILTIIQDAEINDLIFAVGMYGAMNPGTIRMMKNLSTHPAQDYDLVRKAALEKSRADSLQKLTDSISEVQLMDSTGSVQ